jgi:hypothetical protein
MARRTWVIPPRPAGLFVPVYTVVAITRGMPKAPILYAAFIGIVLVSSHASFDFIFVSCASIPPSKTTGCDTSLPASAPVLAHLLVSAHRYNCSFRRLPSRGSRSCYSFIMQRLRASTHASWLRCFQAETAGRLEFFETIEDDGKAMQENKDDSRQTQ